GGPRVRIDRSQRRPLRVEQPERRDARGVGEANQEPRLREGERPRNAVCGGVELHEVVLLAVADPDLVAERHDHARLIGLRVVGLDHGAGDRIDLEERAVSAENPERIGPWIHGDDVAVYGERLEDAAGDGVPLLDRVRPLEATEPDGAKADGHRGWLRMQCEFLLDDSGLDVAPDEALEAVGA